MEVDFYMAQPILLARKIVLENGCWEWTKYRDAKGYGIVRFKGKLYKAHRLSYLAFLDRKIDELLDHRCENKSCINPFHLEDVSNKTNIRRARGWKFLEGKWHCSQGHPLEGRNKLSWGNGFICLICRQQYRQSR